MGAAIAELKRLGAEVIDPADLPSHGKFGEHEFEVLLYEFKADLNAYLAGLGARARRTRLRRSSSSISAIGTRKCPGLDRRSC